MNIRIAQIKDLAVIIEIYNQAIHAGNATADLHELSIEDRLDWFHSHYKDQHPLYVIESGNQVTGWGSLSPYRKGRGGLKETAEISYYIDYRHHGKGYGSQLIKFMIGDCKRLGINNLIAILLEINHASIRILKKFGFEQWGHMPDIVNMNGIVCGHLFYGKKLEDSS